MIQFSSDSAFLPTNDVVLTGVYFNGTFAKPFRWTYTGRPTKATTVSRPKTWNEKWANTRKAGKTLALVG